MRLASTKNVIHTQNFLTTVFKLTSAYVGIVLQVDRNVDACNNTLNISHICMLSHTINLKKSVLSNCNKRLCVFTPPARRVAEFKIRLVSVFWGFFLSVSKVGQPLLGDTAGMPCEPSKHDV